MPLKAPKNLYLDSLTTYLQNGRPLILSLVLLLNKQLNSFQNFHFELKKGTLTSQRKNT